MDYSIGNFCVMPRPMPLTGFGAWVVTSRYEIMNNIGVYVDEVGNGKAWVEISSLRLQTF